MQLVFDFNAQTCNESSRVKSDGAYRKKQRGLLAYQSGKAAEEIVARKYTEMGLKPSAKRWRGGGGEIDLIFQDADRFVFVEVKKSGSFHQAAHRICPRQVDRIFNAATAFVANQPLGLLTEMRFDVALVDGVGRIEILENALFAA